MGSAPNTSKNPVGMPNYLTAGLIRMLRIYHIQTSFVNCSDKMGYYSCEMGRAAKAPMILLLNTRYFIPYERGIFIIVHRVSSEISY
ncbi:hypothetical protein Zmor_021785 [Zophobas morio]|uniref:Uncharacterized protein n=1 Tax=Zophobas morio TaxID=2755281 RepID=A0AA38MBQ5_9CUCU|nr:hypothetical protein Zmor_021785 [Zophobas morio]